jgi:hypothetical protein
MNNVCVLDYSVLTTGLCVRGGKMGAIRTVLCVSEENTDMEKGDTPTQGVELIHSQLFETIKKIFAIFMRQDGTYCFLHKQCTHILVAILCKSKCHNYGSSYGIPGLPVSSVECFLLR